ncbi:MAG: DUF2961 domain-containing protein [Alphaproteobacteria bacterium]|nr:DUF2961 domain-containing protein [Alphaproteobacteria bacterium]
MWQLLLIACSAPPPAAPPSLEIPLDPMLDRDAVTRVQTSRAWQASSTDPRAQDPASPDWFANDDRGHVLRTEGDRFVLVDREGPGVLLRLWSANPERGGDLVIAIDGQPVLTGPMKGLLGGTAGVPEPFAVVAAGGHTLRLPLAYRERLTVSMSENRGKGVYWIAQGLDWTGPVPPVHEGTLQSLMPEIERVGRGLETDASMAPTDVVEAELAPGGSESLALEGPGAVRQLTVSLQSPEAAMDVWLRASFDGVPSVEVPLGGLMGIGRGTQPYRDHWREATIEPAGTGVAGSPRVWTGTTRFVMPFGAEAALSVENRSASPQAVRLGVVVAPFEIGADTLRFRATHLDARFGTRPYRDLTLATWTGPGVLLADTLTVHNPVEDWWGGGDEKIWADGTLLRGTGTEDYYGFAWCSNEVWHGPFGGQARNDRSAFTTEMCDHSGGVVTASRARVLDVVPFERELRFDLGVRHRKDVEVRYEATVMGYTR